MVCIGLPVRWLALVAALVCGTARAAVLDAETPDYLVPDAPAAAIETHRDAEGRLQIEIQGERFDGRRLIKRLLTDAREGPSNSIGADFVLHIAVEALVGFNGEKLDGVDLKLARRGGRIDDFALAGNTAGTAAVRGSVGSGANARRSLFLQADDAGAFLRFVDLYGKLAGGRLRLALDLPAMQEGVFSVRDFHLPPEPLLQQALTAATPPPGPSHAHDADLTRLRAEFTLSPGKVVVKDALFYNKLAGATLEGRIEAGELDLRGVLAPALLADMQEPCSSPCLRGMPYRVTGPVEAPRLVVNPWIENVWRRVPPP
jgi:uncharacterized protein YjbI with pentapeptide repeats